MATTTKKKRKASTIKIAVSYSVETNTKGEPFGTLRLVLPDAVGRRWPRWPERHTLLDLLHEVCRSEYYQRPLRRVPR